jgi:Carboxypeptidase regulatory-like domain
MGTCRTCLTFLVVLAALASAQQPQANQSKLEGVVINGITGKPLPRALVQVAERALLTGPEGEFAFDGLSAGTIQVQASKPGYFAPGASAIATGLSPGSSVSASPDSGKIVLKLSPEAIITGRVTNQDDEPVEGASVQVLAYTSMNDGPQQLLPAHSVVRSDEDGNFRIAGLPAGRYYVAVKAGDTARSILGAQTSQVNEAYPLLVYYPGTEDLPAAVMIDLAPGQQMETPFLLTLRPAYKVAGRVVAAADDWKEVNRPIMVDGAGRSLLPADSFDAKTGAFEFRALPAGTYTVRLSGTDAKKHTLFSNHKITISRAVADLKLLLQPGLELPVVVHAEFTKPQLARRTCGYQQSDCSNYPAARVELIPVEGGGFRFISDFEPMRNPAEFALRGIVPGRYFVRAQSMLGGYVQSVRCGSLNLLQEPLTVAEGGTAAPIEVVVRDDSARLKVIVRPERPRQSITVLLWPEGALLPLPANGMVGLTETYFATVPPGNYKVFAFDSMDGIDYSRSDALVKYAAQAANISLAANAESSVVVNVIYAGE